MTPEECCLQALGSLLDLPEGADLPKELPKAVERLLEDARRYRVVRGMSDDELGMLAQWLTDHAFDAVVDEVQETQRKRKQQYGG